MKIYFGTDHAGFLLKNKLVEYVQTLGYEAEDCGAYEYNEGDDYPDFIVPVIDAVISDEGSLGVVLGGSGQGEAMCANRAGGIRAIVYHGGNLEIPKLGREHNDANILSLGARFITEDEAKDAVKIFIETKFSKDERHIRRLNKF